MPLLEELARKEELRIDFHNHCQTGSSFRKKPKNFKEWLKNLFLSEGFSNVTGILERMEKKNLDVLYITNFSDSRYEDFTNEKQLKIADAMGYEVEQAQYYTFFKKEGKVFALGKSQEIPTEQGHILFAGIKRVKKFSDGKSLNDTLKEANDNELKISDHPYAKLRGQNGVIAYSNNEERDIKKFDALERNGNFYLPFSLANWRALRAGRKYGKHVLANSDSHNPKDIGKTYNIFNTKHLDYSSERAFRDSINYNVEIGSYGTHFSPVPPWRIFHHALMIGMNALSRKIAEYKKRHPATNHS